MQHYISFPQQLVHNQQERVLHILTVHIFSFLPFALCSVVNLILIENEQYVFNVMLCFSNTFCVHGNLTFYAVVFFNANFHGQSAF